jgi:hypothetical protein
VRGVTRGAVHTTIVAECVMCGHVERETAEGTEVAIRGSFITEACCRAMNKPFPGLRYTCGNLCFEQWIKENGPPGEIVDIHIEGVHFAVQVPEAAS